MNYLIKILFSFCFGSFALGSLDCPSDTSYHVDSRTMLPDGSPNPTYGDSIATGLCSCIGFVDGTQIDGNEITFTLRIIDHEPIRGIELDIYNDAPQLEYLSYCYYLDHLVKLSKYLDDLDQVEALIYNWV